VDIERLISLAFESFWPNQSMPKYDRTYNCHGVLDLFVRETLMIVIILRETWFERARLFDGYW
jgi:hypothetical protein